jgi:hypothetical protein
VAAAKKALLSMDVAGRQVANVVLKTPQRKFEDASAEAAPPPAGKAGGTQSAAARTGAMRAGLSADRPRLRAAQPAGPAAGSKLRAFGP